jgi:IS1 family transposase
VQYRKPTFQRRVQKNVIRIITGCRSKDSCRALFKNLKILPLQYAMRSIKPFMSQETLKMVYYDYFHSIMNYGLIFWGNSSHRVKFFKIQKNIIRIITGCRHRDSCRNLLKNVFMYLPHINKIVLQSLGFEWDTRRSKTKF